MSGASNWFSSLASKAENVLNQIDESAASALQQGNEDGIDEKSEGMKRDSNPGLISSQQSHKSGFMKNQNQVFQNVPPYVSAQKKGPGKDRRKLSTSSADGFVDWQLQGTTRKEYSVQSENELRPSRPSSVSSVKSNRSEGAVPLYVDPIPTFNDVSKSAGNAGVFGGRRSDSGNNNHSPPTGTELSSGASFVTSHSGSSYLQVDVQNDDNEFPNQEFSSMLQENKLLKSELQSLTQELNFALTRQRESDVRLRKLTEDYDVKCQESNDLFRKLQNIELDLSEEIRAKDGQIAGYRMKIAELEDKVTSQNDKIKELHNEKLRVLSDHEASSGLHEHNVSSLQSQLQQAEFKFNADLESERSERREIESRLARTTENLQSLTSDIRDLTQKLQYEKQNNSDMQRQLNMSRQNLEGARTEFAEYKSKAVKILQSKEKLIAEMKCSGNITANTGAGESGSSESSSSTATTMGLQYDMIKMEVSQYRYECELLRDEVSRLTAQLESTRDEFAVSEAAANQQHVSMSQHISATQNALDQEKHKCTMLEDDLVRSREELNASSRELLHLKETLSRTVYEKDSQIAKLNSDLTALKSKTESSSNGEFEVRIKTLTDNLLAKQAQIERLNSEKQSLNFQLERLSLDKSNATGSRSARVNISSYDEEASRGRNSNIPQFCRESAFDNQFVKLLKRGLLSVDMFSLSVGVYFRKFALARIFIVIYALILHLWVTVVIMTYKPEIHLDDFQPLKPPTFQNS